MKRQILFGVLLAAALDAGSAEYPARPVRLVVPFGAGSVTDVLARSVSLRLAEALGQQIVVDNRAGAGGMIGADVVAKAAPDGYTLMFGTASILSVNQFLYSSMPYDSATAFVPISQVSSSGNVLVVNPSLPVKTVKELIAYGKGNPGKLNFASTGAGGSIHLSGELFKSMTGVEMAHIAYKASPLAHVDLIGGQVQVMFDGLPAALPLVKAGRLRALGVTAARRSVMLPEVPTIAESGLPGYEAVNWQALAAPAGTPREIISRLHRETVRVIRLPDVTERLIAAGAEPVGSSPEETARHIKSEAARWGKIVRTLGLKAD